MAIHSGNRACGERSSWLRPLLIAAAIAVAGPAGACPLPGPMITSIEVNNYYQSASWPASLTARGPAPFDGSQRPAWFSGADHFASPLGDDPSVAYGFAQRTDADGCYEAHYVTTQPIPDAPYTPVWCVDDDRWAVYCRDLGRPRRDELHKSNEYAGVAVWDMTGAVAIHTTHPCAATSRGARCHFP